LPKGQYAIKKRLDSHLLMTRVTAREKGVFVVDERTMEKVSFQNDYAKGTPIVSDQVGPGAVSWSLSLALGGQVMLTGVDDGGLFPVLPFVSLEARAENLLRDHLLASVDVGLGGTTAVREVLLGTAPAQVTHLQSGASILWVERFFDDKLMLAGGGRMAALYWQHKFADGVLPDAAPNPQFFFSFSPGLTGLAGYEIFDWAHTEVTARAHLVPYTVDEFRPMVSVDVLASIWFDF
jgi:hypothetical protein